MKAPIRLAIIGSGAIAQTHSAAVAFVPEARLTAVCSRNPEAAERLAAPFEARVFSSVDDLLGSDQIDAVLVATPSGVHQDAVLPSLRSGRHVLCEKPLEISTERVRKLVAEAEKAQRILAGFFPMRCGAGARTIRDAAINNRFGRRHLDHVLHEQLRLGSEDFLTALARIGRERVQRPTECPVVDSECDLHGPAVVSISGGCKMPRDYVNPAVR